MVIYRGLRWIGHKLYGRKFLHCHQRLPFGMYCKWGEYVTRTEALAMQFVRQNTTIPVPDVLDVVDMGSEQVFLLMSLMPGEPLALKLEEMNPDEITQVVETLKDWFSQLRRLPPPSKMVSGFLGTPSQQWRLLHSGPVGPFSDTLALYDYILGNLLPEDSKRIGAIAAKSHDRPHRICFTHGDINPTNILVANNKLTALLDWGSCGWFPEYWDYTGTCYNILYYDAWDSVWRRVFPDYETELEVQREIWKVYCPFA